MVLDQRLLLFFYPLRHVEVQEITIKRTSCGGLVQLSCLTVNSENALKN